eukprot:2392997-Rhodomonas_salina.1
MYTTCRRNLQARGTRMRPPKQQRCIQLRAHDSQEWLSRTQKRTRRCSVRALPGASRTGADAKVFEESALLSALPLFLF